MKNLFKKISITSMVALMIMSMIPTFAAETKTIEGVENVVTLNRYVVVDENFKPELFPYNYSVIKLTSYPENLQPTGDPTISITNLNDLEPKDYAEASSYPDLTGKIDAGQKFYIQPITIDFSSVTFSKPGEYIYKLGLNSNYPNNPYEGATSVMLELHVYVIYNEDSSGFKIYCNFEDVNNDNNKISYIIGNAPNVHNIAFTNRFEGNAANLNDKMEFTIIVQEPGYLREVPFTNIKVNGEDVWTLDDLYNNNGANNTLTVEGPAEHGNEGQSHRTYYFTVELGHEDTVEINNIYDGLNVYITDKGTTGGSYGDNTYFEKTWASTYSRTWESNDSNAIVNESEDQDWIIDNTNYHYHVNEDGDIVVTHEANLIIPTGVETTMIPFVIISMISILGIVVFIVSKKHRKVA